jgi:hypothetical protein
MKFKKRPFSQKHVVTQKIKKEEKKKEKNRRPKKTAIKFALIIQQQR